MAWLAAKLNDQQEAAAHKEISETRKLLVGSGDRSERIRTYNYPQGRVTDHRINLTLYALDDVLAGSVESVIEPLLAEYQADQLAALGTDVTIIASLLSEARLPDSPSARLDAELLLAAALGKPRSFLHTWPERVVSGEAAELYASYLARRRNGEPVAYILGRQGFWSLDLEVAPHTLIPVPIPSCWWKPPWPWCRRPRPRARPRHRQRCHRPGAGLRAPALAPDRRRPYRRRRGPGRTQPRAAPAGQRRIPREPLVLHPGRRALRPHRQQPALHRRPRPAPGRGRCALRTLQRPGLRRRRAGRHPPDRQRGTRSPECRWLAAAGARLRPGRRRARTAGPPGLRGVESRRDLGGHDRISLGRLPC